MLSACSDLGLDPSEFDGTYGGTFTITNSSGATETGPVTFIFAGDRYSCTPQQHYLPPSGAGYCVSSGRTLRLKDTIAHTAEFDWTLILNGEFSLTYDGVHLVLQQDDLQYRRHRTIDLMRQ